MLEDTILYVEVSQKGGQVLQFYQTREVAQANYDTEDAIAQAKSLLNELHFSDMACIDVILDENIVDLTFVPKMDGIYIYSDMVKLQIALDDNTLLNFDQTSYATRHYQRQLPAPVAAGTPSTDGKCLVRQPFHKNFHQWKINKMTSHKAPINSLYLHYNLFFASI